MTGIPVYEVPACRICGSPERAAREALRALYGRQPVCPWCKVRPFTGRWRLKAHRGYMWNVVTPTTGFRCCDAEGCNQKAVARCLKTMRAPGKDPKKADLVRVDDARADAIRQTQVLFGDLL